MVNRKTNPVAPATRESAAARAHAGTHGVAVVHQDRFHHVTKAFFVVDNHDFFCCHGLPLS